MAKPGTPYQEKYFSRPVDYAQDQLMGRTHYVDPDTLKFFGARILEAGIFPTRAQNPEHEGEYFYIIESLPFAWEGERIYRGVIFDRLGQAIYRPDAEQAYKTAKTARKYLYAMLEKIRENGYFPVFE